MKLIRQIALLIIGILLVCLTWRSKYEVSVFDVILSIPLLILGPILFFITLYKEIIQYKKEKQLINLCFTFSSLIFITIIITTNININSTFSKPTLLRAYYDGDFNGSSIDFKTDNTYIFENSAIGFSTYIYGNYSIIENKITLDTNNLDNAIETNKLEIREIETQDRDSIKPEKYLFLVNEEGK